MAEFKIATGVIDIKVDRKTFTLATTALSSLSSAISGAGQVAQIAGASLALLPGSLMGTAAAGGTVVTAFRGMGKAFEEGAKAQDKARETGNKYRDALNQLSPAARSLTEELVRQRVTAWEPMQKAISQATLVGITREFRSLSTSYVPLLTRGMSGVGSAINSAMRDLGSFLREGQSIRDTSTGFENTRRAVDALRPGLLNSYQLFRDFSVVGSSFLPQMASGFSDLTGRMARFVAEARRSGELAEFMQTGMDKARQLGRILVDVGAIAGGVFRANAAAGADFLSSLERITDATREWVQSTRGQQVLTDIFRELRAAVDELIPGLASAATTVTEFLSQVAQSDGVRRLAAAATDLVEAVAPLGGPLGAVVGDVLSGLAGGATTLAAVLGPVAAGLGGIVSVLGPIPGYALAAVAAFKLMGHAKAGLDSVAGSLRVAAQNLAAMSYGTSSLAGVAGRASTATRGLATVLTNMGKALPVVGVALVALGAIYEQVRDRSDELAESVARGTKTMGAAIQEQAGRFEGLTGFINAFGGALLGNSEAVARFTNSTLNQSLAVAEVEQAWQQYRSTLGAVAGAEADVARAQGELDDALKNHGEGSREVIDATNRLNAAKARHRDMERQAAQAVKGTTDALKAQADQMLANAGGHLAVEASLRQIERAQKDADQAIKESGKNSLEARDAVGTLARQYLETADRMREFAAQAGAADGGVSAFNTSLATMNISTAGGRAALEDLASGMSQAELDMISAAAAATGLRTQVVNLPDGKRVTIIAEADREKAVQNLQDQLNALTNKTVVIDGNTVPLGQALKQVQDLIAGTSGTVVINGNPIPADQALANVLAAIQRGEASVTINGRKIPAQDALTQILTQINDSSGTVDINGNKVPAGDVLLALLAEVNRSSATTTIKGEPTPAQKALSDVLRTINTSSATTTIRGNPEPFNATMRGLIANWNGRSIYVNIGGSRVTAGGGVFGFSGGGLLGYAGGGVHRVSRSRGAVIPGYRPGVDSELTWTSPGEAVLVPELVRRLGAARILAANAEASGGRPATIAGSLAGMMDGTIPYTGGGSAVGSRGASVSTVATGQPVNLTVNVTGVLDFRDKTTSTRQVVESIRDALRELERSNA